MPTRTRKTSASAARNAAEAAVKATPAAKRTTRVSAGRMWGRARPSGGGNGVSGRDGVARPGRSLQRRLVYGAFAAALAASAVGARRLRHRRGRSTVFPSPGQRAGSGQT
jgi:hypothetical protein